MQAPDWVTNGQPERLGELERHVLRVCFLPEAQARAEWETHLSRSLRVVELPPGSHGLLPLLHRRLSELDLTSPDMERLQGVRRRLWVQNELRLRTTRTALDLLEAAGTEPALIGGAAVLVAHHRRSDLRALHDVDVLVQHHEANSAIDALAAAGWGIGPRWRGGYVLDLHGVRTTDPGGGAVSLRWRSAEPTDAAVERSLTVAMGAASARCVTSADLLVHTVLDGPRAHLHADVLTILRDERLDGHRVRATTAARHGSEAMAIVLRRIQQIVPGALPAAVEPLLTGSPPWLRRQVLDPDRRPTAARAYLRRSAGTGWNRSIQGLAPFLCELWDVRSTASLPREMARRARRRFAVSR